MANTRQAEDWNGETGRHWLAHEDRYDTMLARLTGHLLDAARITPADRVLDVGCGCGPTTRLAARQAAEGTVLGVDLSEPMIERAARRAQDEGLGNVRFEVADVQVHDFAPEAFDLVLSRLGVMFFDDPHVAFVNLRRALRPGGRLAFACWQALERNQHRRVLVEAVAAHIPVPGPAVKNGPGPFSFADPGHVREVLAGAGFGEIALRPVEEPLWSGADADDATDFVLRVPLIRDLLAGADPAAAAKATTALRETLAAHQTPEGVLLGSSAWLVTARRL